VNEKAPAPVLECRLARVPTRGRACDCESECTVHNAQTQTRAPGAKTAKPGPEERVEVVSLVGLPTALVVLLELGGDTTQHKH